MTLTDTQCDALAQVANVGFRRAADSLSQLTGQPITVQVPRVELAARSEIISALTVALPGNVVCVDQPFAGPIVGNGLLLMEQPAAMQLTTMLGGGQPGEDANTALREILTEVGNILLNACLGVFDHAFGMSVTFSVPKISVSTVERAFQRVSAEATSSTHALLMRTRVELSDRSVSGYIVVMPQLMSLDRLLQEVSRWEERQGKGGQSVPA